MKLSAVFCVAMISSAVANASDNRIVVSASSAKGTSAVAIDVVSDGSVSAFQTFLHFEGVSDKQIDLSGCLSNLPKDMVGRCDFSAGKVVVAVYSPSITALPAGLTPVGVIKLVASPSAIRATDGDISNTKGESVSSLVDVTVN